MKHLITIFLAVVPLLVRAEAFPYSGVDKADSEWMREWFQSSDLRKYAFTYSDYVVYQTEATGDWGNPEPYVMSVNGNSYQWNKFYLNDFRIDSRFEAGSTDFDLNLREHSLSLDYHRGRFYLTTDSVRQNRVVLQGTAGNLGGYDNFSQILLRTFHPSGVDRVRSEVSLKDRMHTIGSGAVEAVYGIPSRDGNQYYQRLSAQYGRRHHPYFDHLGPAGAYNADYYKVQLDGDIPYGLHYIFRSQGRDDWGSEHLYNKDEVARKLSQSFSLYGQWCMGARGKLTTGLTYAVHTLKHQNLEFSRNIVDQDGEGFEPWYPDGNTHELSWAVNYRLPLLSWLRFHIDSYNSLVHHSPTVGKWTNELYYKAPLSANPNIDTTPWQCTLDPITWSSRAFSGGMLENEFLLEAEHKACDWFSLNAQLGLGVDGMLLRDKQIVTPALEAELSLHFHPVSWFSADITVGNYRTRYSYNDLCYLSSDYMNGESAVTTTGGAYHQLDKNLRQPQYFGADIPFRFTIQGKTGTHELSVLTSLKKYYNTWTTVEAEGNPGWNEHAVNSASDGSGMNYNVYTMRPGERNYVVTTAPIVEGANFFFRTPLFASNTFKYAYNGKKVFFSISWQSYVVSGFSGMGNGVKSQDIQVLSESTASPNNVLVNTNQWQSNPLIRALGRLEQDRAFIARMLLGVNITENWQLSLHGKFRDGTPMSQYLTRYYQEGGTNQVALWRAYTRGDNIVDTNFGERKDSFFNFDLRLAWRGMAGKIPMMAELTCYNIWDFATELNEYCFDWTDPSNPIQSDIPTHRSSLQLCIPRGLHASVMIGLP